MIAEVKAQWSPISGKGRLTQPKILKVQNYYGRAIKDNFDDIEILKKFIFAILFHIKISVHKFSLFDYFKHSNIAGSLLN